MAPRKRTGDREDLRLHAGKRRIGRGRPAPIGLRGEGLRVPATGKHQRGNEQGDSGDSPHGQLFCAPARIQSWISWICAALKGWPPNGIRAPEMTDAPVIFMYR